MLLIPGICHRFYVKLSLENHVPVDLRCQIIQGAKKTKLIILFEKNVNQ